MGRKQKIVLPPELPPKISEDEVEVSDEDLQFVNENRDYTGFVSNLDTHSITRHVSRVADVKEDALEALYERRSRKNSFEKEKEEEFIPGKLRRGERGLEVNGDESQVLGGGSNVVGMKER